MHVDIAQSGAEEGSIRYEIGHFVIVRSHYLRECTELSYDQIAFSKITQCNFTDHMRMHNDRAGVEKLDHARIAFAQVIHPNRRVGQDHDMRRRGGATKSGSVPPSAANRRAAGR